MFDRLFFSFSDRDEISCSDPTIPCDESNLVCKALKLFRSRISTPFVKIHIEKKIPVQAGLGGGSSNAATALWGLNQLMEYPLSEPQLRELGACIGSDVPFFFSSGTAYCTGRGEVLQSYQLPEVLRGYIAKPSFGLSTPLVYQNAKVSELPLRDPLQALKAYPQFFNDLEISSFRLEPRLIDLREQLQKNFQEVVMTGSGTAFFCLKGEPSDIEGVSFFPFSSTQRLDLLGWF